VVSRSQALKAIKERDEARKDAGEVSELYGEVIVQRDQAESERKRVERELRKASITQTNLEMEAESLRQQLSQKPEPEVIEREVVREVESQESKRRIAELEHSKQLNEKDNATLRRQLEETRKKLDRAKVLLEEKGYEDNANWDISTLTSATNQYLRTYGGKAWAFDQFYRVDEVTQREFEKAITTLAAFATNLTQMIQDKKQLGA
jgi:chromosome segregation ATPase